MTDLATQLEQAHAYLDRLPPAQLSAVRSLLESMVDPVTWAIAHAPTDDEPLSREDRQALAEADAWLKQNKGIPHEQVLAELGITQ